jgi:hypothetical protein
MNNLKSHTKFCTRLYSTKPVKKIKVAEPVVEIDGDEMARCGSIVYNIILAYIEE